MRATSGKKKRFPPRTLLMAVASSAPNCTPTPTVVSPTPACEASRARAMKLPASVAPTFGRSSVNSMTRVVPLKLGRVSWARSKPNFSPASMLVEPALWIVSMVAWMRSRCESGVGARTACTWSP